MSDSSDGDSSSLSSDESRDDTSHDSGEEIFSDSTSDGSPPPPPPPSERSTPRPPLRPPPPGRQNAIGWVLDSGRGRNEARMGVYLGNEERTTDLVRVYTREADAGTHLYQSGEWLCLASTRTLRRALAAAALSAPRAAATATAPVAGFLRRRVPAQAPPKKPTEERWVEEWEMFEAGHWRPTESVRSRRWRAMDAKKMTSYVSMLRKTSRLSVDGIPEQLAHLNGFYDRTRGGISDALGSELFWEHEGKSGLGTRVDALLYRAEATGRWVISSRAQKMAGKGFGWVTSTSVVSPTPCAPCNWRWSNGAQWHVSSVKTKTEPPEPSDEKVMDGGKITVSHEARRRPQARLTDRERAWETAAESSGLTIILRYQRVDFAAARDHAAVNGDVKVNPTICAARLFVLGLQCSRFSRAYVADGTFPAINGGRVYSAVAHCGVTNGPSPARLLASAFATTIRDVAGGYGESIRGGRISAERDLHLFRLPDGRWAIATAACMSILAYGGEVTTFSNAQSIGLSGGASYLVSKTEAGDPPIGIRAWACMYSKSGSSEVTELDVPFLETAFPPLSTVAAELRAESLTRVVVRSNSQILTGIYKRRRGDDGKFYYAHALPPPADLSSSLRRTFSGEWALGIDQVVDESPVWRVLYSSTSSSPTPLDLNWLSRMDLGEENPAQMLVLPFVPRRLKVASPSSAPEAARAFDGIYTMNDARTADNHAAAVYERISGSCGATDVSLTGATIEWNRVVKEWEVKCRVSPWKFEMANIFGGEGAARYTPVGDLMWSSSALDGSASGDSGCISSMVHDADERELPSLSFFSARAYDLTGITMMTLGEADSDAPWMRMGVYEPFANSHCMRMTNHPARVESILEYCQADHRWYVHDDGSSMLEEGGAIFRSHKRDFYASFVGMKWEQCSPGGWMPCALKVTSQKAAITKSRASTITSIRIAGGTTTAIENQYSGIYVYDVETSEAKGDRCFVKQTGKVRGGTVYRSTAGNWVISSDVASIAERKPDGKLIKVCSMESGSVTPVGILYGRGTVTETHGTYAPEMKDWNIVVTDITEECNAAHAITAVRFMPSDLELRSGWFRPLFDSLFIRADLLFGSDFTPRRINGSPIFVNPIVLNRAQTKVPPKYFTLVRNREGSWNLGDFQKQCGASSFQTLWSRPHFTL